jgi:uncharacterized protein YndB with AHSA1/START domain
MNTQQSFVVRKKITLNAAPSKVWQALTDPEKTKKYFFNCGVYSEWKEGSSITFKGRVFFFINIELKGTIQKIEPGRLLKYVLVHKDSSGYSTVTDEITTENGHTVLKITDDVGQGKGAEKRYKRSQKGWNKILRGLRKEIEKEQ